MNASTPLTGIASTSPASNASGLSIARGERIRVRGTVQGVGFRPTVFRIAHGLGVRGRVTNDGEGVLIEAWGEGTVLDEFVERIRREAPPLARIEDIERSAVGATLAPDDFRIVASAAAIHAGLTRTRPDATTGRNDIPLDAATGVTLISPDANLGYAHVPADAAACAACVQEVFDPFARRFRYPFTNCTHCGPRLTIVEGIPYDRAVTTMARFSMCTACAAEYHDPADRRFHAQPIACHACGPRLTLVRADGRALALDALTFLDEADAACTLLSRGHVVAIQGVGGYQLACDAASPAAVARLRAGKRREHKPFALMARDLDIVRRYCRVSDAEARLLASPEAPIVLLERAASAPQSPLAETVAPGLSTLGFMLPSTPLHHLMLKRMGRPIVLTSGNLSDEPQAITGEDAHSRLGAIAEYYLEHDRPIARRVDDSVARVAGNRVRVLRRARGYAPAPLQLPAGFEGTPRVLAYGGELKNTFCFARGRQAILSPHLGDLHDALTRVDYARALADFSAFFEFEPRAIACDLHPDYASTRLAQAHADQLHVPLVATQHHHAHIAACMVENGVALRAAPVLGVALDGSGYGADGTIWGGEFLLADYSGYRRLGTFKPVAMLGGEAAVHEPWRSTYAHLMAEMGWASFAMNYAELDLFRFLEGKPRDLLDGMALRGVNSPLASSCGRLFDAVAAAVGITRERAMYEGQGAVELEALVDRGCLENEDEALDYPFAIPRMGGKGLPYVEPLAMWQALLGDLVLHTPAGVMAARFHRGLAKVIVRMVVKLAAQDGAGDVRTVVLSGGVFQNRIVFERVQAGLEAAHFTVLTHSRVPCNDGGLALGQAAIAAARLLRQA